LALEGQLDAATDKSIDLGLDATPVHANGYEWLLRELLANLLDNAVRYTPQGGSVTLRCGRDAQDQRPYLEVEDDGPGVPEAERSRVLERFYRVPGTGGEGTGLGMAIADEIARLHHSVLELGSGAAGRGLRVRLSLSELTLGP
jgi:two-component system sensor histidine kinase TctE